MSELFKFSKVLIAAICSFKIVDDKPVQKDTPNNAGVFWLPIEYSCAITPQVRQAGNRLSGLTETAYASLLA